MSINSATRKFLFHPVNVNWNISNFEWTCVLIYFKLGFDICLNIMNVFKQRSIMVRFLFSWKHLYKKFRNIFIEHFKYDSSIKTQPIDCIIAERFCWCSSLKLFKYECIGCTPGNNSHLQAVEYLIKKITAY